MSERKFEKFTDPRGGVALGVRVITRSAATEIAGKSEEGAVKIRLIASPAGNPEANKELIDFLAARLGVASGEAIVDQAVASAHTLFASAGHRPADPVETQFHDWQRDPFAMGGYSYVTAGAEDARDRLAAPVGRVLFFAGEATETGGEAATVAGALMSGERAAAEYVRTLKA